MHHQAKGIVSRLGSFISSKFRYGGPEQDVGEAETCVKDIHLIDNFIAIITHKDLIIIRRSDGMKIYERDYLDQIKEIAVKNDQFTDINVMRQTIEFRLIASSAVNYSARKAICINFFILRSQFITEPQTQQTIKKTQIINKPKLFVMNETNTELEESLNPRDEK